MDITGIQLFRADKKTIWTALNDPAILNQCLPGCESVERVADDEFRVVVAAAIGPLRARFNGKLRMTEVNAPTSCIMVFEGQGGAIGFGRGSSTVTLRELSEGTELSYSARAEVGGKLAQVGSRLIESVAKKMSDDFFKAFRSELEPRPEEAKPNTASLPTHTESPNQDASSPSRGPVPIPDLPSRSSSAVTMVPGWWLLVAAALGSALSLAGAVFLLR